MGKLINEAFHYNTTNQCNHHVTELFEIEINHTTQKLKSIKQNHQNRSSGFRDIQRLHFGPSLGGAFHLLNNFFTLQVFVNIERWLKCQFYDFWSSRIQKLH